MSKISNIVRNAMRKIAYVPLAPAAQDAMAQGQGDPNMMPPPGDPNMGGMPMPPMDPSMGGMPPQGDPNMMPQGGAPIQTVPGPNGEPIDPETGFVVIDPQQGIEQDPLTGILFSKFTGEFATPDGQPLDPQQAQMMIEQAMSQGGGTPPQGDPNAMPPMDSSMDPSMGGMPPQGDPNMMPPPSDPSMGGMPMPPPGDPNAGAPQGPVIDDQTGLPIDPETGYYTTGSPKGDPETAGQEMIPGLEQFMSKAEKVNDRQDKAIKRMTSEMVGTRTDIQGLKREIEQMNDNQDVILARMENLLALLESAVGGQRQQLGATPVDQEIR